MKSKASPGSIFTRKGSNKLIIKVGKIYFSTGLPDTVENRRLCEKKMKQLYLSQIGMGDNFEKRKKPRLFDAVEHFQNDHLFNKAPKTIETYNYSIGKIATHSIEINRESIADQVRNFLSTTNLSLSSIEIVLRHYQTFVNWLYQNDYLDKAINIKRFNTKKAGTKEVQVFSEDEVKQLIDYWTNKDPEFAFLLRFMLATGGRIGETLKLEWNSITDKWILFHNKFDSAPEKFPLYDEVKEILNGLPKNREKVFKWSEHSKSRLNRRLNKSLEELEIPRNGRSFHEFRKTFRMRLFANGAPLEVASQLLRHRNVQVTMKHYTEYKRENLEKYVSKPNGEKTAPELHQIYNLLSAFMKLYEPL